MVKYEYRVGKYVGDWAALLLAVVLLCASMFSAYIAEQNHKEAYFLTRDCYEEKDKVVRWTLEPVNQIEEWSKEVDVNVSLSDG